MWTVDTPCRRQYSHKLTLVSGSCWELGIENSLSGPRIIGQEGINDRNNRKRTVCSILD
jgi:hypothetical protein